MNKVKNTLVLLARMEILISAMGLGHWVPVCGFHTQPQEKTPQDLNSVDWAIELKCRHTGFAYTYTYNSYGCNNF